MLKIWFKIPNIVIGIKIEMKIFKEIEIRCMSDGRIWEDNSWTQKRIRKT